MLWITGWIREQLQLPVNKLLGLRYVGTGLLNFGGGAGKVGKRYRAVWKYYFGDSELFYKRGKVSYELHPENEVYEALGKVRMFYVDVQSGAPVGFWDGVRVAYSPRELNGMQDTSDVETAVRVAKRGGVDWMWIVMGGVVGAALMFVVKDFIPLPKLILSLVGVC